jgi:hypothetical protein
MNAGYFFSKLNGEVGPDLFRAACDISFVRLAGAQAFKAALTL